ncbi:unnamed protein product [Camellia sinensis]
MTTMLDLQQGLTRNHFNFLCQPDRSIDQMALVLGHDKETGFQFWGEQRTDYYNSYGDDEVDFQAQTQYNGNDGACSPQAFWTSKTPLLPRNHQYSYLTSPKLSLSSSSSSPSRLQAIIDGRRKLTEKIQDMPESWYELSLKDIVDEQHDLQANQKDIIVIDDEKNPNFKPEIKMKQQKKKCRRGQMTRSESMDSRVLRLKIIFPISPGLKRKSKAGNRSKVSPRPSLDGPGSASEKTRLDKKWWRMRFLSMGKSKSTGTGSTSSSSSSSSKSRDDDINFIPGCWPFHMKYRSTRQRECLPE